jgi:nucleoid-associated protein YgaU
VNKNTARIAAEASGAREREEAARAAVAQERDEANRALQAAIARATQARQEAMNANGQTYFPDEWRAVETRNTSARNARRNTPEEMKSATELYISVAETYEDIAKKSAPMMAREREEAEKGLEAAIARAERSRQQATDANGQTNFPNDWRTAETRNNSARNARRGTVAEMRAATGLYNGAADAYDDIVNKNTARIAEEAQRAQDMERQREEADKATQEAIARAEQTRQSDWENSLIKEREAAVAAGIESIAPARLLAADRAAEEIRKTIESGTSPSVETLSAPIDMYRALVPLSEAHKLREEITKLGYEAIDPVAKGDESTWSAIDAYEAGSPKVALTTAEEAIRLYNEGLRNAQIAAASEATAAAQEILTVERGIPWLAAQYLVKSWNTVRDCLWNIAGKPQIYGDPFRWELIYDANRDKIEDPDIIHPGMILDIPSIAGEYRYGILEEDD